MKKSTARSASTSSKTETDVREFDTLAEAIAAVRDYVADDGVIEVHEEDCDGEDDCGCGFKTYTAAELYPKARA